MQLGISLSFDFIDSPFSSSILSPFGFIRFSSEIFRASGSANAEVVVALYKTKVGYRIASYLIPEDSRCESQGFLVTERFPVLDAGTNTSPDGPWPAEGADRFCLLLVGEQAYFVLCVCECGPCGNAESTAQGTELHF